MGNKNSRVAPTKTLHIFDNQTRARYRNQRESNNLRSKMRQLHAQHHDEISRITFDQQDVKTKLHELHYDKVQRELFKNIDKDKNTFDLERPKSRLSTFNLPAIDGNPPETSSLLLYNLYDSRRRENRETSLKKPKRNKPPSAYETFQLQYASKLDLKDRRVSQTEAALVSNSRMLQRETEQMKKSIQTAVAKAARDSNMYARRDTILY
ncbi:unnamed protein product [Adineta ricciae]|uniref:Uncharacterized protein n=1 Tax=Adineta ricciae TaxID=249248 RepID=A0A815BJ44_ADIRI|nr:unnamed protein product [Adineta ricciae]